MKYLIFTLALIVLPGCGHSAADQPADFRDSLPVRMFDPPVFGANEYGVREFTDEEGCFRRQYRWFDGYLDYRQEPGDIFEEIREYDRNGNPVSYKKVMMNHGFTKGMEYRFANGQVIETIDHDRPFEFGWESVFRFMRGKGIDPYNSFSTINRTAEGAEEPHWTLRWNHPENHNPLEIKLSGLDGRILEEKELPVGWCGND